MESAGIVIAGFCQPPLTKLLASTTYTLIRTYQLGASGCDVEKAAWSRWMRGYTRSFWRHCSCTFQVRGAGRMWS